MSKLVNATLLAASLICGSAMAAEPAESKSVPAAIIAGTTKMQAEVIAIDLPSRKVTLKGEDGNVAEVVVGDHVKNLAQVKVGDHVVARYTKALTIKLKKGPGLRMTEEKTDAAKAEAGDKPGAAALHEVNFVADVIGVNTKAKTVRIKGAKGRVFDLSVKDPEVLAQVKVGDQVEGTYLEVMAIGVVTPKGKK
jgi:hypothetical protein